MKASLDKKMVSLVFLHHLNKHTGQQTGKCHSGQNRRPIYEHTRPMDDRGRRNIGGYEGRYSEGDGSSAIDGYGGIFFEGHDSSSAEELNGRPMGEHHDRQNSRQDGEQTGKSDGRSWDKVIHLVCFSSMYSSRPRSSNITVLFWQ